MIIDDLLAKIDKSPQAFYFIVDETGFCSDLIVAQIEKTFLGQATLENRIVFQAEELDREALAESLQTVSLFSSKRMVIIKGADKCDKGIFEEISTLFEKGLKECCLVLCSTKKPPRGYPSLKKKNCLYEFKRPYESHLPGWVRWMMERSSKQLTAKAGILLLECVGTDLYRLQMEIEKLSLYVGDKSVIEEEDVRRLLLSTRSHSIFELTSAIGHQQKVKALKLLTQMIAEGESEIFIFSMIVRHLRQLWKAIEWESKKSDVEVGRLVGIHPFFWDDFRKQRDQFLKVPFEALWQRVLECDHVLKTSSVNKGSLLSHFVATLSV